MIIPTYQQVLDGDQTQLRIVVKPGDWSMNEWIEIPGISEGIVGDIAVVRTKSGGIRWIKDHTYAVQPHFGQKAIARIRITGIRQERVQDISEEDAVDEGMPFHEYFKGYGGWSERSVDPKERYAALWDTIHTKRGEQWADNPAVWVLEFELVREAVTA